MAYIKREDVEIGDEVILTEEKGSLAGHFEIGTRVKIVACDNIRGYSFEDEYGNVVLEAGYKGFKKAA